MSNVLDVSDIKVTERDSCDRFLSLYDIVDSVSVSAIINDITAINKEDSDLEKLLYFQYGVSSFKREPIILDINSLGGLVYDGLALIATIEQSKTPVITKVNGYAFSMGVLIFLAGHERLISRHASLMYHQVSSEVFGKLKDMEEDLLVTKGLQTKLENYILERSTMTLDNLKKIYRQKKDVYISAEEALAFGLATKII